MKRFFSSGSAALVAIALLAAIIAASAGAFAQVPPNFEPWQPDKPVLINGVSVDTAWWAPRGVKLCRYYNLEQLAAAYNAQMQRVPRTDCVVLSRYGTNLYGLCFIGQDEVVVKGVGKTKCVYLSAPIRIRSLAPVLLDKGPENAASAVMVPESMRQNLRTVFGGRA